MLSRSSYQPEWTELPPMVMVTFRSKLLLRGMLGPCPTTAKVCVDVLCPCYYKRPMWAISVEVQGGCWACNTPHWSWGSCLPPCRPCTVTDDLLHGRAGLAPHRIEEMPFPSLGKSGPTSHLNQSVPVIWTDKLSYPGSHPGHWVGTCQHQPCGWHAGAMKRLVLQKHSRKISMTQDNRRMSEKPFQWGASIDDIAEARGFEPDKRLIIQWTFAGEAVWTKGYTA